MMRFTEWMITESGLRLGVSPGLEQHEEQAKKALDYYLRRSGAMTRTAALSRFNYTLEDMRESYHGVTFVFKYAPKENRRAVDDVAPKDDERWKYYPDTWDGRTGARIYPSPTDAIAEIPANAQLAWRGMSWEEWRASETRGYIQSAGEQNLSAQNGLTFYGHKPATAVRYAGSFASHPFTATPKRPGVIIGVPRARLMDHTEHEGVHNGEFAHVGALPLADVQEIYLLVAVRSGTGTLELNVSNEGYVSEGSRDDASMSYAIRRFK